MATITTDEQFRMAAGVWIPAHQGVFLGTSFVDAAGRKIFDERPQPFDVTPPPAELEAALDTANTNSADENTVSASSELARTARHYLRDQLRSNSPNLNTIFTTIKTFVDNNPAVLQVMLNNAIDGMAAAYGWNAVNVKGATGASTNAVKAQYIEAAKSIVSLFA